MTRIVEDCRTHSAEAKTSRISRWISRNVTLRGRFLVGVTRILPISAGALGPPSDTRLYSRRILVETNATAEVLARVGDLQAQLQEMTGVEVTIERDPDSVWSRRPRQADPSNRGIG